MPHVDRYRQAHERNWLAADIPEAPEDDGGDVSPSDTFPPEWP